MRLHHFIFVPFLYCASASLAQAPAATRPLPDIATLMRQVETLQREAETRQKDYIYRELNRFDQFDGSGKTKKTHSREYEIFWLNGIRVARLLQKDGKDLTPDEQQKESEHIDKEVDKARERRDKANAEGRQTDSAGHDEISFSRMLQLGTFTNARREFVRGRDTIAVDFTGDPKAKTRNAVEGVFRELAGTVWVDEQDKAIQHLEGHFVNNFKVGAGLLVNVHQGTWFKANFTKINDEVWLPETVEGNGHVRYMLFFTVDGSFQGHTFGYRKFKATSRIVPNAPSEAVPTSPAEHPASPPAPPTPPQS